MQRTEISEVLTAIFSSNIPQGMGFPQLSNRLKCAKKILIKIKTSSEINSVILHCTHWRLHGPRMEQNLVLSSLISLSHPPTIMA